VLYYNVQLIFKCGGKNLVHSMPRLEFAATLNGIVKPNVMKYARVGIEVDFDL
jgi:hypothetical protein